MSTFLPQSVTAHLDPRVDGLINWADVNDRKHADLAALVRKLTVAVEVLENKVTALESLYRPAEPVVWWK